MTEKFDCTSEFVVFWTMPKCQETTKIGGSVTLGGRECTDNENHFLLPRAQRERLKLEPFHDLGVLFTKCGIQSTRRSNALDRIGWSQLRSLAWPYIAHQNKCNKVERTILCSTDWYARIESHAKHYGQPRVSVEEMN